MIINSNLFLLDRANLTICTVPTTDTQRLCMHWMHKRNLLRICVACGNDARSLSLSLARCSLSYTQQHTCSRCVTLHLSFNFQFMIIHPNGLHLFYLCAFSLLQTPPRQCLSMPETFCRPQVTRRPKTELEKWKKIKMKWNADWFTDSIFEMQGRCVGSHTRPPGHRKWIDCIDYLIFFFVSFSFKHKNIKIEE